MSPSLVRAEQALQSAQHLAAAGSFQGAADRAYFACFHAARAALEEVRGGALTRKPKTHRGLIHLFSTHVVKTGLLPRDVAAILGRQQNLRIVADDRDDFLRPEDAADATSAAEIFVRACRDLVARKAAAP